MVVVAAKDVRRLQAEKPVLFLQKTGSKK